MRAGTRVRVMPTARSAMRHCAASRHSEVTSAARAACSGSDSSVTFGWTGRTSMRSRSSRERRPRCSARSDRISQPSPPGARCAASRRESRAACGCRGRRSRARAASWAAPAPTAGCRRRARRGRRERDRLRRRPPAPRAPAARGSRARTPARAHPWSVATTRRDAAPREHGGQHAGAGADVEGDAVGRQRPGQRRVRDQFDILAADGREDAVVRMDAPPSAGISTPFLRHSCAPIRPSSSRSDTIEGASAGP
jgi:hypothetical protein